MITILRLGHRVVRDQRITTHVALTSRAFGADKIVISGEKDEGIVEGIKKVCEEFGGDFEAEFTENWEEFVEGWKKRNKKGTIVHLTMYGLDIDSVAKELAVKAKKTNMLIVVGGPKVPTEMYNLADYNVAVGSQPHSEVAAIAIMLDRVLGKKAKGRKFKGGNIEVIPNPRGKTVLQKDF